MVKRLLFFLVMGMTAIAVQSSPITFSYNPMEETTTFFGFDSTETYDVAILLDQPALQGSVIEGISVPLPDNAAIVETTVWLSSSLNLKRVNGRYVNNPDILSVEGNVENGVLSVTLPEPYRIEGSVYVGYSFTVTTINEVSSAPVAVMETNRPDGLWIHTTRTYTKWTDMAVSANMASVITVALDGTLSDNAATITNTGELKVDAQDTSNLSLNLENHGANPINSVKGTYTIGEISQPFDFSFYPAIEARYGAYSPILFNLPDDVDFGATNLNINITEVNGEVNTDPRPETEISAIIYPFIPVYRPLVEEYTGMWCGYCPRGYVALETMKEKYPDRFVGIEYHYNDVLQFIRHTPSSPATYPTAYINRGSALNPVAIYSLWPDIAQQQTTMAVEGTISWEDTTRQTILTEGTTTFIEDYADNQYGMCFILVADNLTDPTWTQANSYAPKDGEEPQDDPDMPGELGQMFTHGTNPMTGLVYNGVAIAISPANEHVIPRAGIGTPVSLSASFDINPDWLSVMKDYTNLRCVVAIVNIKNDRPLNCISTQYIDSKDASISVNTCSRVVRTEWYDIQGRRLNEPVNSGISLEVKHYDDGHIETVKLVR